jgi:cytochrome c biogenesis protein CcmG/thiol:disulfide interchange protein DsbE
MSGQTARRKSPAPGGRRWALLIGALVVIAGLAVAAVLLTRGTPGPGGGAVEQTRPLTVEGADLPTLPEGASADPAAGQAMPTLRGASFDGTPVTIAPDGHAKVIVFVAHWCPHCQREVPELVSWLRAGGLPRGVEIYAVSTAVRPGAPEYPPSEWLRREGWTAPVLVDSKDGRAALAAGLSAFPFFVFVDAKNTVVQRLSGERPIADIEARVRAIAPAS